MRLKPRFSLLLTGPKAGLVGEPDHDWSVHPLHYDRVLAYTAEDIAAARRDALRKELEIARLDSAMIDWLERSAAKPRGKIEIAASILKRGFEIGEWPSMHVTVSTGRLRDAIDAAMAQEKP